MGSAAETYADNMYGKFRRHVAWPPNRVIKLGDIGVMDGAIFERRQSLRDDLGFKFKVRAAGQPVDLSYKSGRTASVSIKAAGKSLPNSAIPVSEAGARISFSSAGAFVFQATGCVEKEIEGIEALGKQILKWMKSGDWKEEWVVVDSITTVDRAAILVSESRKAELELSTKAGLGAGGVSLANADVTLSIVNELGTITRVIGKKAGLTPLFAVSRIKFSIWNQITGGEASIGRATRGSGESQRGRSTTGSNLAEIDPSKVLERVKR